jgi:DNA-binding protein WhiA
LSFSAGVKNEIARILGEGRCCLRAELAALLAVNSLTLREEGGTGSQGIVIATENAAIARKVFTLFKKVTRLHTEVAVQKGVRFRRTNTYMVRVPAQGGLEALLQDLAPLEPAAGGLSCCWRAYLRGAFLAGGSITNPERGYHLEIAAPSREVAAKIGAVMEGYDLVPRMVRRKGKYVIYLKEGEQLVRFLSIVGAHRALLEFENIRVYKDVRNNINRLVNCDTANLGKTVEAARRQVEKIRYLERTVGLDSLPLGLREVARMRLEHPDLSLKELGQLMTPKLGKSGVNHRLRRLEAMADGLQRDGGMANG